MVVFVDIIIQKPRNLQGMQDICDHCRPNLRLGEKTRPWTSKKSYPVRLKKVDLQTLKFRLRREGGRGGDKISSIHNPEHGG